MGWNRHVAVGMARQGFDLQLTRYDACGWRATFYTTGMEHSPTSATGSAWGAHAVARDAAGGLGGAQEGRDELTVRGPTRSALELPRCEGLAITSYALVLQGVN